MLVDGGIPYTDLSVLEPYNARRQRAEASKGMVWGTNGFQVRDLKGPPAIDAWTAS